jgi:hypothetical protein
MSYAVRTLRGRQAFVALADVSSKRLFQASTDAVLQRSSSAEPQGDGLVRRREPSELAKESPKNDWVPVVHKESGLTYWWRPSTGTTAEVPSIVNRTMGYIQEASMGCR